MRRSLEDKATLYELDKQIKFAKIESERKLRCVCTCTGIMRGIVRRHLCHGALRQTALE
jgi:hypothetical protein